MTNEQMNSSKEENNIEKNGQEGKKTEVKVTEEKKLFFRRFFVKFKKAAQFFRFHWQKIVAILIGIAVIISIFYYLKENRILEGPHYAEAYTLVNDAISASANITINLPSGASKESIEGKISFSPEIKGKWIESGASNKVIFDPDENLEIGKYYSVALETERGIIGKDFMGAENPTVVSVFPRGDSEANEKSDITVIFNRPMTPLTTLDVLDEMQIPLEIEPKTYGKFKWIGTRSLQFVPEKTLIASANYKVKVKSDFTSMDGLNIENFEHKFVTRKLRYNELYDGALSYREPIRLSFNQPVDFEKTIKEISLENETTHSKTEFIAEFGTKKIYNKKTQKYDENRDESVILVFNSRDRYGREKFWDFNNNYKLVIERAYPQGGDINLDERREANIQVSDVIADVSASSERTNFSAPELFDPQGKLWVEFYEDVDLKKSEINADKLADSGYGEKCKGADAQEVYYGEDVECEKEPDKKKIYFAFDKDKLQNSENIKITFNKILNFDGLQLNVSPITKDVLVFPKLKILRTVPANNGKNSSLTDLVLCTNSPLAPQPKGDIDQYLKVNLPYEFKRWDQSIFINEKSDYYKCAVGEFENKIGYGLMPEKDYQINLKVADDFEQEAETVLNFRTEKMPEKYLNFYHFQKEYNITTPDKTRLTYAGENMDYVDMHICELNPEDMLYYLDNKPNYWESPAVVNQCASAVSARIDLKPVYWIKNYFKVDLKDYVKSPRGHFILTFTNPGYKERYGEGKQVYERTYLTVTNLGVVEKKIEIDRVEPPGVPDAYDVRDKDLPRLENLYWVTNINKLEAVPNARIDLFSSGDKSGDPFIKAKTIKTDQSGIAKTTAVNKLMGAVISIPNDSAIVSDEANKFEYASNAYLARKMYVYTDRPIYRPGDEAHIKGFYRIGYDGSYEIFRDRKISLAVFDGQGKEVFNKELDVNDFGAFNADLILDTQGALGQYRIEADGYGYGYFDVEEYSPSPFKVETKTDKDEYISGDTMNMDIDANYYFGAPVEGGEVEYSIGSQDYYFDKYEGEYFSFGAGWYYCYYDCDYGDKFILRDKVPLDASGKTHISHILDINKLFKKDEEKQSKIFVIYVTVKNKNGQAVSAQKSFIVHKGEFYLGLNSDKSFLGKSEQFNLKMKSVDTSGKEVNIENISIVVNKVNWAAVKRKEVDGGYYYRWEKRLEKVEDRNAATDGNGNWSGSFSLKDEGEYEIIAKVNDKKGNAITANYDVYVWGEGYAQVEPSNDEKLDVITDKANVKVGDQANIIIKSPYDKAKALISIERGQIYDYKIIDIDQSLYKYSFDILESYIPNIFASVTLISGKPEVKFGKVEFNIDIKEKEINIEVKLNKEFYLPGEEVILDFEAKDSKGNPQSAEISAAVADLSVLALKGNPKKNPLVFFYDGFPLTVMTASNVKNILYEVNVPTGTKGGGGGEPGDLAKKKRGVFKDTAFWQAVVRTDESGKAQVKFNLPDNLTTWQAEAVGITKDTKLGAGYKEFIAKKELMVVPLRPRFIIPGDEFLIGAQIFNQTDDEQKFDVSFSSSSLVVGDEHRSPLQLGGETETESENPSSQSLIKNVVTEEKHIKIKKGETETIYFNAQAPSAFKEGWHKFTLSAKNDKYEDTVEQAIKIRRNDTYEATATSGYSNGEKVSEYVYIPPNVIKDKGDLKVSHSATLAVFLSDALQYLFEYPYGCSEQVASKLEAIATVKKGLKIKNLGDKFDIKEIEFEGENYPVDQVVEIGLARIYETQQDDGGFAYYHNGWSNIYLTLHIMNMLYDLKDAGYNINENSLLRALEFARNKIRYDQDLQKDNDFMIIFGYTQSYLKSYGIKMEDIVAEKIKGMEHNEKFINEDISSISLAYLAILLSREEKTFGKKFKDKIFKILENRITIDSRGAFLETRGNLIWQYYETSVKDSALLIKALTLDKRDNQILDRILRWLLNSRKKDGAWGSTNNTITVIDAMTDYLAWQKETESNFTLKVNLNDSEKSSFTYAPQTILSENSFSAPISELGLNSFNRVIFSKENHNNLKNNFYYDMSLKYYLPIDSIAPRDEGFTIKRNFYRLDDEDFQNPVLEAKVGDVLRARVEIIAPTTRNFVAIEDFIPAGVELVNFNLETSDQSLNEEERTDWTIDETLFMPDRQEFRDDRLLSFKENVISNTYHFEYYVRVLIPGKFHHLPAVVSEMYTPENFGRTSGGYFEVKQ